jgi:hypothetical protein
MTAAIDLVGQMAPIRVKLDRGIDRRQPCCSNIAIIAPGKPPHVAELKCKTCGKHRGWLRAEALTFIESLAQQWSAPVEPIILRDTTIGDHQMTTERKFESKPNSGVLFKNTQKHDHRDTDYKGSVNVEGREFWLNAWVNTSKQTGQKYIRLLLKLKTEDAATADAERAKSTTADFNDDLPF